MLFRKNRKATRQIDFVFSWEQLHTVRLTGDDLDTLVGLCETKAFEHLVCPSGDPARKQAWYDLAQRLRSASAHQDGRESS